MSITVAEILAIRHFGEANGASAAGLLLMAVKSATFFFMFAM